jgi:SPP1 gp7 family putative phage head morphogenesis protein
MRQLHALPLLQKYWLPIEKSINAAISALLFQPLAVAITTGHASYEILNTGNALLEAIRDGLVWYDQDHFAGAFNSKITIELRQIGATFNAPSRTWSLPRDRIPTDIRFAQAGADDRYRKLREAFLYTLDHVNVDSIDRFVNFPDEYAKAIDWMEDDFQKTLSAITIPVQLTPHSREMISKQWGQNLDLYVKGWVSDNIIKLRSDVQTNAFGGRRANDLVKMIQDNYGVSQRKAKFLARQETSLLMSKFRETRYRDIGANRYRWSTSHDERVRHDHHDLNGKIYSWDDPPVTNRKTGARNNPGEDFGCRCVAIALVE